MDSIHSTSMFLSSLVSILSPLFPSRFSHYLPAPCFAQMLKVLTSVLRSSLSSGSPRSSFASSRSSFLYSLLLHYLPYSLPFTRLILFLFPLPSSQLSVLYSVVTILPSLVSQKVSQCILSYFFPLRSLQYLGLSLI